MTRPRTLRARVALLSALAGAVVVVTLVAAFNLALRASLTNDVRDRLRTTAEAVAATTVVRDGRVVVRAPRGRGPVEGQVWIYEGTRALRRPAASERLQRAADALAGQSETYDRLGDHIAELYAEPITDGRRRQVGTVVTAELLDAWDHTTDLALAGSSALGALLVVAILGLAWSATGRALAPVRKMTRRAAAWSAGDVNERFGGGPRPDELGELARTFDELLDRVAASLRHEQRLSAELSHELRTPLARITAEVELLRRRERPAPEREEALAAIARSTDEMSRILETLMTAARADASLPRGRADVAAVLRELRAGWDAEAALTVELGDEPLAVGADPEVLERVLGPLLQNAARHARERVSVQAGRDNGRVRVVIADDGAGVAEADRERIFEPGVTAGDHRGAGLGLALARRLARAAGGDVVAAAPAPGERGGRFEVSLPA